MCLTHGMYEYFLYCKSKYPDVDKTKLITDETTSWCKSHLVPPSFVVFPNTVVNYQKITFTPFNDYTIMNENEFEKISEQAYKVLKNVSIIGDDLVNLIKENIHTCHVLNTINKYYLLYIIPTKIRIIKIFGNVK